MAGTTMEGYFPFGIYRNTPIHEQPTWYLTFLSRQYRNRDRRLMAEVRELATEELRRRYEEGPRKREHIESVAEIMIRLGVRGREPRGLDSQYRRVTQDSTQ